MSNPRPGPGDDPGRFLAALVDSFDEAIIGKDLDGIVVSWSKGAERLYGYTAEEAVGRSLSFIIPDDRAGELEAMMVRIRRGERIDRHETVRRGKDGRAIDVSLTITPVVDASGRIVGAATIARDLTAQLDRERARRASDARWQSVAASAVDGIIVIDAKGRIESFNPAAERLFGYRESEVVGRNVNILMPSPDHDEHDRYLAAYLTTGHRTIIGIGRQVTGLRRDGTTFPVHLSVGEMVFGGERKFTGILHDLTDRVRLEEQLREQTALARLGEMAAVLAHEVKNPLAGIRGALQVIGGRLDASSREAGVIKEIIARVDALNALMKDLLVFARPPKPHPVLVELGPLVTTTADLLRQDPALGHVSVEIEGSAPAVPADPELLKIVFHNLLINGAHAMQGRGRIRVSLTAQGGASRVAFIDNGPGIAPEIREKIFTPFFTTKSRGSGLGLPTAKRLIEAHHGRISVECPAGGGTTVNIELPRAGA